MTPGGAMPRPDRRLRRIASSVPGMPLIYLNVAVSGVLTGLVYGLMALGLSVIFGVVRVVNFAHGEMMTIAMYHRGRAVRGLPARSAGDAGADRGGAVRLRLRCCRRADQPVHHAARAQPVHAAGRDRDHHRQRAADRLRARTRSNVQIVLCLRQLPDRPADRRRHQGLCRRRRDRGRGGAVRVLPLHARSARRSAPAPTTTPARWWSGSTSSTSMR